MQFIEEFKEKARRRKRTIIYPESWDERVLKASEEVQKSGIADIILLGEPENIRKQAEKTGLDLSGVELIDHRKDPAFDRYVDEYTEMRKHKGMTRDLARKLLADPLFAAAMMVKNRRAAGYVSGAATSTASTLRPALQIIGSSQPKGLVSSFFIMALKNPDFGHEGIMVFADCALVIDPTPSELARIAVDTAISTRRLLGFEPRVAMLSFSTAGSAQHKLVDRVKEATSLAQKSAPEFIFEGEIQADAAIIPSIASKKFPGTRLEGKANVLIFPCLDAGNIGYKLVQRLAGAEAIGPIIQGLKQPVNDLSRGCSVSDIVNVTAITSIMAE